MAVILTLGITAFRYERRTDN